MRTVLTILATALIALPLAAQEATPKAPYFTTPDSGLAAAGAREYLVLDFFSET